MQRVEQGWRCRRIRCHHCGAGTRRGRNHSSVCVCGVPVCSDLGSLVGGVGKKLGLVREPAHKALSPDPESGSGPCVSRGCPAGLQGGDSGGGGVGGEGGASGSGPVGPGARRGCVGSLLDILDLLDLLRALGGCCATHTAERGDSPALPRKSGRGERRAGADRGRVGLGEGRRTGRYPPHATQTRPAPPLQVPVRCARGALQRGTRSASRGRVAVARARRRKSARVNSPVDEGALEAPLFTGRRTMRRRAWGATSGTCVACAARPSQRSVATRRAATQNWPSRTASGRGSGSCWVRWRALAGALPRQKSHIGPTPSSRGGVLCPRSNRK